MVGWRAAAKSSSPHVLKARFGLELFLCLAVCQFQAAGVPLFQTVREAAPGAPGPVQPVSCFKRA
jgi:hypothetical protein